MILCNYLCDYQRRYGFWHLHYKCRLECKKLKCICLEISGKVLYKDLIQHTKKGRNHRRWKDHIVTSLKSVKLKKKKPHSNICQVLRDVFMPYSLTEKMLKQQCRSVLCYFNQIKVSVSSNCSVAAARVTSQDSWLMRRLRTNKAWRQSTAS